MNPENRVRLDRLKDAALSVSDDKPCVIHEVSDVAYALTRIIELETYLQEAAYERGFRELQSHRMESTRQAYQRGFTAAREMAREIAEGGEFLKYISAVDAVHAIQVAITRMQPDSENNPKEKL